MQLVLVLMFVVLQYTGVCRSVNIKSMSEESSSLESALELQDLRKAILPLLEHASFRNSQSFQDTVENFSSKQNVHLPPNEDFLTEYKILRPGRPNKWGKNKKYFIDSSSLNRRKNNKVNKGPVTIILAADVPLEKKVVSRKNKLHGDTRKLKHINYQLHSQGHRYSIDNGSNSNEVEDSIENKENVAIKYEQIHKEDSANYNSRMFSKEHNHSINSDSNSNHMEDRIEKNKLNNNNFTENDYVTMGEIIIESGLDNVTKNKDDVLNSKSQEFDDTEKYYNNVEITPIHEISNRRRHELRQSDEYNEYGKVDSNAKPYNQSTEDNPVEINKEMIKFVKDHNKNNKSSISIQENYSSVSSKESKRGGSLGKTNKSVKSLWEEGIANILEGDLYNLQNAKSSELNKKDNMREVDNQLTVAHEMDFFENSLDKSTQIQNDDIVLRFEVNDELVTKKSIENSVDVTSSKPKDSILRQDKVIAIDGILLSKPFRKYGKKKTKEKKIGKNINCNTIKHLVHKKNEDHGIDRIYNLSFLFNS